MKVSPARAAAFEALSRIERDRAFSSIILPEIESVLSAPDRALCHQMTLGVLRRQIYLDSIIDHFAAGKKLDRAVRIALRLGIFQLRYLDRVPDHSAVNESVGLVQRAKKTSAKGLVNAVLRRSIREPFEPSGSDDLDGLALRTSHPRWLLQHWADQIGYDDAAKLAAANNETPEIAFRLTALADVDLDAGSARRSTLVRDCYLARSMTPELMLAASEGKVYFQDEASQMVGALIETVNGGRFLDVCAAPGSKTTQIAGRPEGIFALSVAGDRHIPRAAVLKEACRRQGLDDVSVLVYDAEVPLPFEQGTFDTVLVDAPCSGTGTIRHNPEIRYFLRPDDFDKLSAKQRRILKNASKMVKPGGTLVYSTCSLEREENEAVVKWFTDSGPGFTMERPPDGGAFIRPDGMVQTLPYRDGTDGFYAVILRRGPV